MRTTHKHYIVGLLIVGLLAAGSMTALLIKPTSTAQSQATAQHTGYVSYIGRHGMTALAELKQVAHVSTQSSSYGEFVTAINNVAGGTNNTYWDYYINGKLANVGAGSYKLAGGEKVEWKLEK